MWLHKVPNSILLIIDGAVIRTWVCLITKPMPLSYITLAFKIQYILTPWDLKEIRKYKDITWKSKNTHIQKTWHKMKNCNIFNAVASKIQSKFPYIGFSIHSRVHSELCTLESHRAFLNVLFLRHKHPDQLTKFF